MHFLVGCPARAGSVFFACEEGKKLQFFEMHTCVGSAAAQIMLGHKGTSLDTSSLLLNCIGEYRCFVSCKELFSLRVRVWVDVSSYCPVMETFTNWFKKWLDQDWAAFWVFLSEKFLVSSILHLLKLKFARIAHLVIFLTMWNLIDGLFVGYFGPFFKCACSSQPWFFQYRLMSWRNSLFFICYVKASPIVFSVQPVIFLTRLQYLARLRSRKVFWSKKIKSLKKLAP